MTLPLISSLNTYGGTLQDAVPLIDPTSELPAAALNPLRNDVSAMTATAPRLLFQFLGTSGSSAPIASTATWTSGIDSVWGNSPALNPVITHIDTGIYQATLPASVPDQIVGSSENLVNVRFGRVFAMSNGTFPIGNVVVQSSNTFKMYLQVSGSLDDCVGVLLVVEVY